MFWGNKIDFIQSVDEQVLISDSLKKSRYSNLDGSSGKGSRFFKRKLSA